MKIGFIGLGNMGLPMAINLVKAGHEVAGFDLVDSQLKAFAATGGKVVANAHAAAQDVDVARRMAAKVGDTKNAAPKNVVSRSGKVANTSRLTKKSAKGK